MEDPANEREIVVDRLRSFNFEPVNAEGGSIIDALQKLFQSKSRKAPPEAHPPPG
jgi:hypothetical protein